MKAGFSTTEGLIAIGGLAGGALLAIIGFGKRFRLTGLFIFLISLFFTIYGKKLCTTCEKSCPCNPDLYFWKKAKQDLRCKR